MSFVIIIAWGTLLYILERLKFLTPERPVCKNVIFSFLLLGDWASGAQHSRSLREWPQDGSVSEHCFAWGAAVSVAERRKRGHPRQKIGRSDALFVFDSQKVQN